MPGTCLANLRVLRHQPLTENVPVAALALQLVTRHRVANHVKANQCVQIWPLFQVVAACTTLVRFLAVPGALHATHKVLLTHSEVVASRQSAGMLARNVAAGGTTIVRSPRLDVIAEGGLGVRVRRFIQLNLLIVPVKRSGGIGDLHVTSVGVNQGGPAEELHIHILHRRFDVHRIVQV